MRKKCTRLTTLAISICLGLLPHSVQASSHRWLVNIETHNYPNRFNYANSKLNPLVKCKITYAQVDGDGKEMPYKTIYYCNRKASGLERSGNFDSLQGADVAIKISPDSPNASVVEYQAAANATIRVLIDLRIHKCRLGTVKVPGEAWEIATEAFANEHYLPVPRTSETPFEAKVPVRLEDQDGTFSELLSYCPIK